MADLTVSFELYNEEAVRILKEEDPDLLPTYTVNSSKDLAYNKKQVTSTITSGIIKGESIPKISKNLQSTMNNLNKVSAVRAARTAATSAQNAGKLSAMKELAAMGVEVQKEWVATLDSRTRPSHRALDGQRRDPDEPFSNGLQYPGASGNPAERWNCRCTMESYMPKYDSEDEPRLTYSEWVKYKQSQWSEPKKVSTEEYVAAQKWNRIFTAEEVADKIYELQKSDDYKKLNKKRNVDNIGNERRKLLNKKLGYDGLPNVVKEDEFITYANNSTVLYRAYHDDVDIYTGKVNKTAKEMIDELKYGDLWTGISGGALYGTGIYFADTPGETERYGKDGMVTAVINKAAKIVDYDSILNEFNNRTVSGNVLIEVLGTGDDVGKYAAIKNYDAIYVSSKNYYVILNRSILMIKE